MLTIVKILPAGENLSPTKEDIERWRKIFSENQMSVEEAEATGEVTVQKFPDKKPDDNYYDNYLTVVKIGNEHFHPTFEDLEEWRRVFEEASKDPDFKIFTHPGVEIDVIRIGDVVAVE